MGVWSFCLWPGVMAGGGRDSEDGEGIVDPWSVVLARLRVGGRNGVREWGVGVRQLGESEGLLQLGGK